MSSFCVAVSPGEGFATPGDRLVEVPPKRG